MFKADRIRIRGTLLREIVQLVLGGCRTELGMVMQDKMLLMQAQENGVVLEEEELLFLAGEQANTFDADVDNQPVQDMALNEDNVFQVDELGPANLQAGSFNASLLSEVPDLTYTIVTNNEDQVEYEIPNKVQQSTVIDSDNADMGNSNVIPYEQYMTSNDVSVVPSDASYAPNNAYVLIDDNVHTTHEPLVTELAIYKEQVAIYEQRAKFELTEREQRMDDQMRTFIQSRNQMEEKLKQELHSVKLQLNHSLKSQTAIQENLKNKLENKLHAQDQFIQTVHMMLRPKNLSDLYSGIAIGAKNPSCHNKAKGAQPALYDGTEIVKIDHDPMKVRTSEEEIVASKASRKKMHEKLNNPVCVEKKINCMPPNYIKENFLVIFTPHTQLTPEQVFWAIDLEKRKAEELKANASALPVLPPATVYPPNTPDHLVPRMLPTTSQVNIGLYVITQLFWDFEKTCKKRITPTGITEGGRGFEQTKRCYLMEVIPFFNLLKEHFDGVQKSLVTKVRAMKAIFEEMEAEVDQYEVAQKYREIERKNLLITNENLIANCIAQDVFYTVTDSALTTSSFHDLSTAYDVAMKRVVDLESENSHLLTKIKQDDHDTMIKDFSKLEVAHFNLQLKHQHLKEKIENLKSRPSKDALEFDVFFELGMRDDQIQSHKNTIRKNCHSFARELENFKAENEKVKRHYQELFDSIKINRAKTIEKTSLFRSKIENLKTQLKGKTQCVTGEVNPPKVSTFEKYAVDVKPIPPRQRNNSVVHHGYLNSLKDTLDTLREIVEEARSELPSDSNLDYACVYAKRSQELLANVSASCPKIVNHQANVSSTATVTKKKGVTFAEPLVTSGNNTPKHVQHQSAPKTNAPNVPSIGKKVEEHPRNNKSRLSKMNRVDSCTSNSRTVIYSNSNSLCRTCNECIISSNHAKCVEHFLKSYNKSPVKQIWRVKQVKQIWKPTGKLFTRVGHYWKPTGRILPLGAQCPLSRITIPKVVPKKIWKPIGRIIPLEAQYPLTRPTASTSEAPVDYDCVCTNELEPNGSKRTDKYGELDGYTSDDPILILEILCKLRWRWRYLVPMDSIHKPMLTLKVSNLRHHDNRKTYNTASATLRSIIMIKKSVCMRKAQRSHKLKEQSSRITTMCTMESMNEESNVYELKSEDQDLDC
ncbi:hypothetical protein Tco_0569944 [Tanacetum coccineum]